MHVNIDYPIDPFIIRKIAGEYTTLLYRTALIEILSMLFPKEDFGGFTKYQLHHRINDVLLQHYKGEQELKYQLFKRNFDKKVIAGFEIKVHGSRADFLTINGVSSSYEIKSSLDNVSKLERQAIDYTKAFDYNFAVIDAKHLKKAEEVLPSSFGIWSFKNERKKIHRVAERNKKIDPEFQLSLLSKKELEIEFPVSGITRKEILREFNSVQINTRFKSALKRRYKKRWNFLLTHKKDILPVDLQFFFNTNISPEIIYGN